MPSDPLQPPALSPTLPVYGLLPQIVRTTGSPVYDNVYPAMLTQYTGNLSLRDRDPCYVTEPNGVVLGPGYYDSLLVDSFPKEGNPLYGVIAALPLFVTTCCVSGDFGSSSSSSSSGSSGSSA
ncbi:MAG: hypothetical protein K2X38_04335 [Gemmataceae bacterium]|nr:hypothetical protein [Gemmataceae bacterium]